ncbi:hypothetical protein [Nostoc sp. DedQUE03]|uniref:hypothetical protein n=1 Tax=Nostoc sp. DedQUE03 TaxID=3075389 RepID=UPI00391D628B
MRYFKILVETLHCNVSTSKFIPRFSNTRIFNAGDALALQADALTLYRHALALQADALTLYRHALALQADALTLYRYALALQADALALQGDAKFNLLQINEMQ